MTVYLASIPRCGSTYLFRSLAHLPQGGHTPPGAQETYGIVKTHRTPAADERVDWTPDDRALFVFGNVVTAVVSTYENRMDERHFRNCGAEWPPDRDIRDADILGYRRIWQRWTHAPFPVLCVRYSALRDHTARTAIEAWTGRRARWLPWRERSTVVHPSDRRRVLRAYARLVYDTSSAPDWFFAGSAKRQGVA